MVKPTVDDVLLAVEQQEKAGDDPDIQEQSEHVHDPVSMR